MCAGALFQCIYIAPSHLGIFLNLKIKTLKTVAYRTEVRLLFIGTTLEVFML